MQDPSPEPLPRPGDQPPHEKAPQDKAPQDKAPRVLRSDELLQGKKEVVIDHEGETYRLRLTRNGRLVLYK